MKLATGAAIIGALALVAVHASAQQLISVASEASGSDFFSLSAPVALGSGANQEELTGRVCRLRRSTLLSPSEVRVEHLNASGNLLGVTDAPAAEIAKSDDQPCVDYDARVAWTFARGDKLRACFESGRRCPTNAAALALASR